MDGAPEKIRYVQRVMTDRGPRLYFRRGTHRRPLRNIDGSPELKAEVEDILAELDRLALAQTPRPGTVGGILAAYSRSADFLGLARSTQASYQRLIDEIEDDLGDVLLADVSAAWVADLKNIWAPRGHRAANLRLQVLKNAIEPAIVDKRVSEDPFARLKKVRSRHEAAEPNPVWEDIEVDRIIGLALERKMPGLARAIALGRWGGFRRGSICKIPLSARAKGIDQYGRPYRRLNWLTEKRRVECDKPEDSRLTDLLDGTPNRAWTIAYNRRGEPWRERQLNQAVDRLIESLSADGRIRPVLTLHGLRHSRGVELAEAGASDSEIMSQLEHRTVRAAQIYRRQAERRRLAASAQTKIDTARRQKMSLVESAAGSRDGG